MLVIKPGSLGDVLMAGAALATLRAGFPDAHIVHLVGSWARPAAAGNPSVDALLDCGPVGMPGAFNWRQFLRVVARVRSARFDAAIVLDRSPLMASLPWLAGINVRAGIDSAGRGFPLNYRVPPPPQRHEGELYLDVVRRIGLEPVRPRRWFRPRPSALAKIRSVLGGDPPRFLVVAPGGGINPGARRPQKRWSPQGFVRVARRLRERAGLLPVLVGDDGDVDAVGAVRQSLDGPLLDLSQRLSFAETGALLQSSHGFMANDSAIAHLGAAVGASGVVIYTVTDPAIYGPAGDRITKLTAKPGSAVGDAAVAALLTGIERENAK